MLDLEQILRLTLTEMFIRIVGAYQFPQILMVYLTIGSRQNSVEQEKIRYGNLIHLI
ncbi:hypothetical protein PCC21_041440 [Pectobacterium carotovorum subsp. carotovorum PCC21]|nr:hypothetical protein PCC21_041440 [Pectobacterium carotovorum subsp. carotovorum PCC21]